MNTIRTFEVYLVGDLPHGYEIEKPYPASLWGYDEAFNFPGKSAHIVIVSNDGGINRTIALRFATAIARGAFVTFNCDLTKVSNPCPSKHKK